jgi:hypothetical protein
MPSLFMKKDLLKPFRDKLIASITAVQNKLEGAFKIGIRPQIGLRLKAEVSVERIAGSEQNRDLLPPRYTLFATRYNLILQPMAFSLLMPIQNFILDRCVRASFHGFAKMDIDVRNWISEYYESFCGLPQVIFNGDRQ